MLDLSEAVLHWLAYQRCVGIDQFINESALTTPIITYLSSMGWVPKKETDYRQICEHIARDKCFADFSFARGDDKLILETKLFKASAQNKIFDDLLRLALPLEPSLKRLALVAFSREKTLWGEFQALLNLPIKSSLDLDPRAVTLRSGKDSFALGYNSKEFAKLCAYTSAPLSTISITCEQRTDSKKYAVVVFSVARKHDVLPG
jgi:hypothetical protein